MSWALCGYWTSLATIGPDDKIQFDGQKQDQFRFTGQPATWLICAADGLPARLACRPGVRVHPVAELAVQLP